MLSYFLYYLSLEKCLLGFDKCCLKINWIKKKLVYLVLSSINTSFLLVLIYFGLISKKNLIHFIIVFILFYNYSHGQDFDDHGFYNIFGFFSFSIILSIISVSIINILILIKKRKNFIFIYISLILIILLIYKIYFLNIINCNDWSLGLNMTKIENNITKYGCQIEFPKICAYKIGKYFLDITKLTHKNCNNKKDSARYKLLKYFKSKYIKSNTKRFGFPITTNYPICCYKSHEGFKDYHIFVNYIKKIWLILII